MRLLWNVDNNWVLHVWLLVVTEEPTVYSLKLYNEISNYFKNTFLLLIWSAYGRSVNEEPRCKTQAVNQSVSQ